MWSIGVISYILLCGSRPFYGRTESAIFRCVLRANPNFEDMPWPSISPTAKDFVKRLLNKDHRKRMTAAQALGKFLFHGFRNRHWSWYGNKNMAFKELQVNKGFLCFPLAVMLYDLCLQLIHGYVMKTPVCFLIFRSTSWSSPIFAYRLSDDQHLR